MWYPGSSSFMNCRKCSNLRGGRYDMPYPCSVSATPAWLHSRCLLLLLIFLSGSGDLSDTRAWKGLIKRRYCQRWLYRDVTVWLMVSFTADEKRKETQTREDSAKKRRKCSNERNNSPCASSWTAKSHKEEYVMIYLVLTYLIFY